MTCKDCIHLKACAQWYPENNLVRDECHKNCKHFDNGDNINKKEGDGCDA